MLNFSDKLFICWMVFHPNYLYFSFCLQPLKLSEGNFSRCWLEWQVQHALWLSVRMTSRSMRQKLDLHPKSVPWTSCTSYIIGSDYNYLAISITLHFSPRCAPLHSVINKLCCGNSQYSIDWLSMLDQALHIHSYSAKTKIFNGMIYFSKIS